jgi:hypothetical protein
MKYRIPDYIHGTFTEEVNLTETGIGYDNRLYKRIVFDKTVNVKSGQHIEIDADDSVWLCTGEDRVLIQSTVEILK